MVGRGQDRIEITHRYGQSHWNPSLPEIQANSLALVHPSRSCVVCFDIYSAPLCSPSAGAIVLVQGVLGLWMTKGVIPSWTSKPTTAPLEVRRSHRKYAVYLSGLFMLVTITGLVYRFCRRILVLEKSKGTVAQH